MHHFGIPLLIFCLLSGKSGYGQRYEHSFPEGRIVHSQDYENDTLQAFFDIRWNKVDRQRAWYFTIAYRDNGLWYSWDYYIQGKSLKSEGAFSDQELKIREGQFFEYHTNGKTASQGKYFMGEKLGLWIDFDEEGYNTDSLFYIKGIIAGRGVSKFKDGSLKAWYDMDRKGLGTGYYYQYYPSGILNAFGKYIEGMKKDSIWAYYYENDQISFSEIYQNGVLLETKCFDSLGNYDQSCMPEIVPQFPGGNDAMLAFLGKNIKFPSDQRDRKGFSGKVMSSFNVGIQGNITDVKITKSLGASFDDEVIRVIKTMPKWIPGYRCNVPIETTYNLPVSFRVE
jgi:TonB family protein